MPISKRCMLSSSLLGLLLGFVLLPLSAAAQTTSEWTWMGGSSTGSQSGIYGTMGTPAPGNIPGSREAAASCSDKSGNYWLFGGYGVGGESYHFGELNDLWEFNPSKHEWTWMGGSNTGNQSGVYGTLVTPAVENIPGGRLDAVIWADNSGNLWLFGGVGFDDNGNEGELNDLWEFNPSINEWAWMGGSSTVGSYEAGKPGVYGKLGTAAAGNIPGGRQNVAYWTDSSGNLWLFGGDGFDINDNEGELNDLWEFNPSINEWTWMGGSNTVFQPGVYGTLGGFAAGNIPGGRLGAVSWTDKSGHFWLFGGIGVDSAGTNANLNDLWEFIVNTNEWAWIAGSSTVKSLAAVDGQSGQPGVYGEKGRPLAGNVPGGREYATGWTDSNGNLWLFGGKGLDDTEIDLPGFGYINYGYLNDLWEFSPSTNIWTWISGSNSVTCFECGQPGVYGTLGTPSNGNVPGGRSNAVGWSDNDDNLWLFGGEGFDVNDKLLGLNDLWNYYLLPAATPTFSPVGATYTSLQSVTITDFDTWATIYYTTDGVTIPTTASTQYTSAITVSSTETIQAIAVAPGYSNSAVASATYTIQPGFTITGTPVTVTAGATSGNTSAITLSPTLGFTSNVALTAAITSGPSGGIQPTLSFGSTTPVSITGAAAGTATLAISTTASSTTQCTSENRMQQGIPWYSGGGAVLACVLLFGIPARRRSWLKILSMSLLLIALAGGAIACGGGGGGKTCNPTTIAGTMPGSYTITVTGVSPSTTSTGTISLTVQ